MKDREWVVLYAGCAECGVNPLVWPGGTFASLDEAKAATGEADVPWKDHPNGGVYYQDAEGATWVLPVSALREGAP